MVRLRVNDQVEMQAVVFQLADQYYAIDIGSVLEIIRWGKITRVPGTPYFVEGIINLRGRVIPVIDLRRRFGLEKNDYSEHARVVIVEVGEAVVGLIVDAVTEVLRFNRQQIEPPPPMVENQGNAFIQGIILLEERLIILLEASRILYDEEKEALRAVDSNLSMIEVNN